MKKQVNSGERTIRFYVNLRCVKYILLQSSLPQSVFKRFCKASPFSTLANAGMGMFTHPFPLVHVV